MGNIRRLFVSRKGYVISTKYKGRKLSQVPPQMLFWVQKELYPEMSYQEQTQIDRWVNKLIEKPNIKQVLQDWIDNNESNN